MELHASNHNQCLSAIKGICIILMVVGHSGCPDYLGNVIYSFHMPCFFVVSGYLFKEKYITDKIAFCKRRFKGLYWEFIKWSFLFLIFHNVLSYIHFYNNSYSRNEFGIQVFKILTMTGSEQLLGGFWFLKDLLYASIFSLFSISLAHKLCKTDKGLSRFLIVMMLFYVILAYILSVVAFKIPTISSEIMLATSYYLLGYFIQRLTRIIKVFRSHFGILSGFIVLLSTSLFHGTIDERGVRLFLFFFISLFGIYSIFSLSSYIKGQVLCLLDDIGKKTLYILALHFTAFKLVSYISLRISGQSLERLSEFPVLQETNSWIWFVYSLIGIAFPLIVHRIINRTSDK